MSKVSESVTIRNANIPGGLWRNFSGRQGKYNAEGVRSFTIFLDSDVATDLGAAGWNVKYRPPTEEEEERYHISVAVSYKQRPPTIVLVTRRGRRNMTEDDLEFLDGMEFSKADLIINPSNWTVKGESGVKAYLKALYVTMHEDELAIEYSEIPEIGGYDQIELMSQEAIEGEIVGEYVHPEETPRAIESRRR
jgi:hypothetical protein